MKNVFVAAVLLVFSVNSYAGLNLKLNCSGAEANGKTMKVAIDLSNVQFKDASSMGTGASIALDEDGKSATAPALVAMQKAGELDVMTAGGFMCGIVINQDQSISATCGVMLGAGMTKLTCEKQ